MRAFFTLSVIFAVVISAIIAMYGNVADASYIIQVEILAVLLQPKYNKEGKI